MKRDVPLDDDDVMVTRSGTRTVAEVSHTEQRRALSELRLSRELFVQRRGLRVPGAAAPARPSRGNRREAAFVDAVDIHALRAGVSAAGDRHGTPRHAERVRQHAHEFVVRGAVNWR